MGSNIGLIGPGMMALIALVLVDACAAAYIVAQVPFLTALAPWANAYALVAPLVLVLQVVYLLRVAFPTHGRLEARLEARFVALADAVSAAPKDDTDDDEEHDACVTT